MTLNYGFPLIKEIREIFEDFFQSGKSGKNRGFSAKIREKIFKSGNFFSKPFSNLLIWGKKFFQTLKPFFRNYQQIPLNEAVFA